MHSQCPTKSKLETPLHHSAELDCVYNVVCRLITAVFYTVKQYHIISQLF